MLTRNYSLVGLYTEPRFAKPFLGKAYFGVLLSARLYPNNDTTDLASFGTSVIKFNSRERPDIKQLEARLLEEMEKLVGSGVQAETRVIPAGDIDFFLDKSRKV